MRHLRLYVDTPDVPRPTPPPPFSSGALTPRLVLRGQTARLAEPKERFLESSSSAHQKQQSTTAAAAAVAADAEQAQQAVEDKRKLRYRYDTGKPFQPPPVVAAAAPRPPSSSSARRIDTNSNVRRPFSSVVRKSSDKYKKLRAERGELQSSLSRQQYEERQAAIRRVDAATASMSRSPSPEQRAAAAGESIAAESARLMHRVSEPSTLSVMPEPASREVASLYAYFFHNSHAKKSPVRADCYGTTSLAGTVLESSTDKTAPFQHRALSPAPAAALAHHVSSADPVAQNEEAKRLLIQPEEEEGDEDDLESPRAAGAVSDTFVVHRPRSAAAIALASAARSDSISPRRIPAMARILEKSQERQQQQQQQYSLPKCGSEVRSHDPRLRRSQDILAAALDIGQKQKFNGRNLFNFQVMTDEERAKSPVALLRRPSVHFMVAVDEAGGPVVTEAIKVAGRSMRLPEPRRPNSARINERFAEKRKAEWAELEKKMAEKELKNQKQPRPSWAAATIPSSVPVSYVTPVPTVFAAGLMATKREDLALSNLVEMSTHRPLCMVEPGSRSVAVPGEFDNRVPRPRSSKW